MRSANCCLLGGVDGGRTKLLDCMRGNDAEVARQIGATYIPAHNILERTKALKADLQMNVPGFLFIDKPGQHSFCNFRFRGSALCDVAILVVDIMRDLKPQAGDSLRLLKMRSTDFIIVLSKVDKLCGWRSCGNAPIQEALGQQSEDVVNEFNMRLAKITYQFKELGWSAELYYKNNDYSNTYSIVPTCAVSGEGIPDLFLVLVQWTQNTMLENLAFRNEVKCAVLEVNLTDNHETTLDVILVNGILHEGDQIVVSGWQGPIVTTIRVLLTAHPVKELQDKGSYLCNKEVKASQGLRIAAQSLGHAIAGSTLYVVGPEDDLEDVKRMAMEDVSSVTSRIDASGEGVCVQASTLGSLESLLEFMKSDDVKVPVGGIGMGPVDEEIFLRASEMRDKKWKYGIILAFDVEVTPEVRGLIKRHGIKVYIIRNFYHLFNDFKLYFDVLEQCFDGPIYPCVLMVVPNAVFHKKDPIIVGVHVLDGIVKVGTPIWVPERNFIDIGRIASIEIDHRAVDCAKKGERVAIKITGSNPEELRKRFGRHFKVHDLLVSHMQQSSMDYFYYNFDQISFNDLRLAVKLMDLPKCDPRWFKNKLVPDPYVLFQLL